MRARDLALDEAMANRADRAKIFEHYLDNCLFSSDMSDDAFIDGLWERQAALQDACERLIALLTEHEHAPPKLPRLAR